MATKKELEIRHLADSAEWALKERGVYHIPNDGDGLGSAVAFALRRRFPGPELQVEEPLRGFGGEYVFRLTTTAGGTE